MPHSPSSAALARFRVIDLSHKRSVTSNLKLAEGIPAQALFRSAGAVDPARCRGLIVRGFEHEATANARCVFVDPRRPWSKGH